MDNFIILLYAILGILIVAVIILAIVYINIVSKEKKRTKEEEKAISIKNSAETNTNSNLKVAKEYTKESIYNFMEFEKVEDSMIVQKNEKRFLMAVECQGINYDLMSDVEKASVESGFVRFLNTLRDPIQIYIQTRTINLEKEIQNYNKRLSKIESSMKSREYKYKHMLEKENTDSQMLRNQELSFIKEKNLFEYGKDVIENTRKMSLNKNILKKKYYIILSYYYSPEGEDILDKEEIGDMAFSNLYTRAISMIRILSGIGVTGKVLDSFDLVDLLYNAYNRDESEVYGIEKALDAGFNELYITSKDVIDKKMEAISKKVEIDALDMAKNAINVAKTKKEQELEYAENNVDDLIRQLAKEIITSNETALGSDISKRAVKEIEEKGEK